MASITPGTGGTIKSLTAEGQAHEILSFLSEKQSIEVNNPAGVNNVLATHNQQGLTYSGSYSFPVAQAINASGGLALTASPYLVGTNFQVGTGGTFKSNTPEAYALEVLMYLQGLEQVPANNPSSRNFVTGTYNSDTGIYQGTFSLPVLLGIDDVTGLVTYEADPYLL